MLKKGFTLIELLVVMSIIALLVSILMPALGRAKEQAKTLVCDTNLKQLVLGWTLYGADNDDLMPGSWNNTPARHGAGDPLDWAWAPWRIDGSDSEIDAVGLSGGVLDQNCTEEEKKEGIRRGSMYQYAENVDLYNCPSDKSKGKNFRSYSMPDGLNGHWGKNRSGGGDWDCLSKIGKIRQPAEMYVFLEENDPRGYNMNAWVLNVTGQTWRDPLTVWHNGGSNLGFADGHAEIHKWSEETIDYFLNLSVFGGFDPQTIEGEEDLRYMQRAWPQ